MIRRNERGRSTAGKNGRGWNERRPKRRRTDSIRLETKGRESYLLPKDAFVDISGTENGTTMTTKEPRHAKICLLLRLRFAICLSAECIDMRYVQGNACCARI
jgi:hypothetical protein